MWFFEIKDSDYVCLVRGFWNLVDYVVFSYLWGDLIEMFVVEWVRIKGVGIKIKDGVFVLERLNIFLLWYLLEIM